MLVCKCELMAVFAPAHYTSPYCGMHGLPLHEAMKAIVIVNPESAKRLNGPELACAGRHTCKHTVPLLGH